MDSVWHTEIILFSPRNGSLDEFTSSVVFVPKNYFKEQIEFFPTAEFSWESEP